MVYCSTSSSNNSSSSSSSSYEFSWTGKFLSKYMWKGRTSNGNPLTILTLIFVNDEDGQVEFKSFNQASKAYYLYKMVKPYTWYRINGSGEMLTPESEYSTSKWSVISPNWYITPLEKTSYLRRKPTYSSSLKNIKIRLEQGKAVNVGGEFVAVYEGPACGPSIQGYHVKLRDINGETFIVLVWHDKRIDKSFPMFEAKEGKLCLFTACREGYIAPDSREEVQFYTITTLVRPLANVTFGNSK